MQGGGIEDKLYFHKLSVDHNINNTVEGTLELFTGAHRAANRIRQLDSCYISCDGYLVAKGGGIPDKESRATSFNYINGYKFMSFK